MSIHPQGFVNAYEGKLLLTLTNVEQKSIKTTAYVMQGLRPHSVWRLRLQDGTGNIAKKKKKMGKNAYNQSRNR